MLLASSLTANAGEVLVVVAERSAAHNELLGSMRSTLGETASRKPSLRTITVAEFLQSGRSDDGSKQPDLVVTVGTDAASAVLREHPAVPVYATFLPRAAHDALLAQTGSSRAGHGRDSALYLDQPLERQLKLLRLALPGYSRLGVVLGPESSKSEPLLQRATHSAGLSLRVEKITGEKQLIKALHRVMDESDLLLSVPDPQVFNRHTAQSVLLTTYRLGKPVAGYSRAYVTAGALLAVYSTPAQIGRQIGEELLALQNKADRPLPAAGYPRYFSVEVNERVAHSLGLAPGRADDLARQLAGIGTEDSP